MTTDNPTCQRSGCEKEAEVTIYFHRTQEENSYCLDHANGALEEFKDARVGEPLTANKEE